MKSGEKLDADIIITATGLNIQIFGGVAVTVDGEARESGNLMTYKGSLLQGRGPISAGSWVTPMLRGP